jgi:hypothetical protein
MVHLIFRHTNPPLAEQQETTIPSSPNPHRTENVTLDELKADLSTILQTTSSPFTIDDLLLNIREFLRLESRNITLRTLRTHLNQIFHVDLDRNFVRKVLSIHV